MIITNSSLYRQRRLPNIAAWERFYIIANSGETQWITKDTRAVVKMKTIHHKLCDVYGESITLVKGSKYDVVYLEASMLRCTIKCRKLFNTSSELIIYSHRTMYDHYCSRRRLRRKMN